MAASSAVVAACTAAAVEKLEVHRRADDAIAQLPVRRIASERSRPLPTVGHAELLAAGCLPWAGTVASPGPLERDDRKAVGRWGEALVYNYLLATLPASRRVTWLNQHEETRAPYDLTICSSGQRAHRGGGGDTVFVEVKTTRYPEHNVFELSYNEWEFMTNEPPVRFHIYRVSGAGDPAGARLTIIEEPLKAVREGAVKLCMAV